MQAGLSRLHPINSFHGNHSPPSLLLHRLVLQFAQQYNAYAEVLAGQAALLAAWQAVLLVAFTRR